MQQQILDFYKRPTATTYTGAYTSRFDELPRDVAVLAGIVQGLLLHEHWAPRYGLTVPDDRRRESQIRAVAPMLDCLFGREAIR